MTKSLQDPVWGKIYVRVPNSGIFRNEETGMEIKEGWAIANGFKVIEEQPDPKYLFDKQGRMYEKSGVGNTGTPIYRYTEMVPKTHSIGYNKAMRTGFTDTFAVYNSPPSNMELIRIFEESRAKEEKDQKARKVVDAVEYIIRVFTNNHSQVFSYAIRDAKSQLREEIVNLL